MSVHKDKKRGTWRVALHYEDAAGKLVNTTKRGFRTKSEALAWERDMLADASASIEMRFSAFYKIYEEDVRPRMRATTWDQKQHVVKSKILPYFGKRKVSSITAKDFRCRMQ